MPHAGYDVYGPRSNATISRSGSRRRAALAALMPAASPPTIASRRAIVAQTLSPAAHSSAHARLPRRPADPCARPARRGSPEPGRGCGAAGRRRAVSSVTDAPWMSEAVSALALELRLHHAPTADHSHRLASLARDVPERLAVDAIDATE